MKADTPVDIAFTRSLPKIELHAHLSGSISRDCLRELWLKKREQDPNLQIPDPMTVMPSVSTGFPLDILRYSTRRVLEDFQADGVHYLELRTTPRESAVHCVSKEQYISTVLDVIDEFQHDNPNGMSAFLILSVDRTKSSSDAEAAVELAIEFKHRGVVGVELGGNPSRGDVSIFRNAFTKAKQNGLGVTLHFAEIKSSGSQLELDTLLSFQPDRIGHVIHVPGEIKEEIVRRKTDDVGFFCSPLSNEYLLAANHFHLTRPMIFEMCKRGIGTIFGGEQQKVKLYNSLQAYEAEFQ
ncbi:hypothetical protein FQN57_004058 [Myotisia sp. PD_48]|nr:hypothetical protein FQN57_004058 [Myotisia sp. PD_48]